MWTACVLTLYPEMFPGPLNKSLAGQALAADRWRLDAVNIRDHATDRHRSVDDTPAGGGPGMVMRADVVGAAIDGARMTYPALPLICPSPRGKPLTQARIRELSAGPGAMLLCGRFEGIDQRVIEARQAEEICIGDYILSGGELAAMVLIDAAVRLLPGVIGAQNSGEDESFENGLLEYPHYTRPRDWEGRQIPDVLLSGNHERIAQWRNAESERITRKRRPDLLAKENAPDRSDGSN
ncbi:MAG: tRNA (guanosine(37)-N1)-methyltransferase TrmD [Hyphomicrobiales bacterium]|nr:tRNA (guanosine(37)-N1)-methyltransferase TrmD [Hyphomicrobiales bacterium]